MSSGKTMSAYPDEQVHSEVEDLAEDRGVSKAEAAEEAIKSGLSRLGYRDGGQTPTRKIFEYVATGTFFSGTTLLLVSLLGSLSLFGAGVSVLSSSLGLALFSRLVIPRFEPELTNRLPRIEVNRYGR
jgi:hypothetical protein